MSTARGRKAGETLRQLFHHILIFYPTFFTKEHQGLREAQEAASRNDGKR
jgi:hypothetical protein